MSGPAEGESFHLSKPELLLMWPIPLSPQHLGLFPPLLFFITHFPSSSLSKVQRTWGWSCQPAFGSSELKWSADRFWPRALRENGATQARGGPVGPAPRGSPRSAFTLPALGPGPGPDDHRVHPVSPEKEWGEQLTSLSALPPHWSPRVFP